MGWAPPEHRNIHAGAVELRCGRRPERLHSSHGRITGAVGGTGAAPRSDHRHPGSVLRGNGRAGAPGLSVLGLAARHARSASGSPRRRRRTEMSTPVHQRLFTSVLATRSAGSPTSPSTRRAIRANGSATGRSRSPGTPCSSRSPTKARDRRLPMPMPTRYGSPAEPARRLPLGEPEIHVIRA